MEQRGRNRCVGHILWSVHDECPFQASFYLFSYFLQTVNKSCQWLDSNPGPLLSEAATLSTVTQPLPLNNLSFEGYCDDVILCFPTWCTVSIGTALVGCACVKGDAGAVHHKVGVGSWQNCALTEIRHILWGGCSRLEKANDLRQWFDSWWSSFLFLTNLLD